MNWKGEKVFITGAGGFIGSHLTERLVNEGAKITAFVHYNSRNDYGLIELLPPIIKKQIEVVGGDLKDSDAVIDAMEGAEYVFHLGALIAIPYSYIHPREVVETNVIGSLNIFNAARINKIKKIIHTSTSEVYGSARYVPIDEQHPLQGQSPYSASKIGADKIAESFQRSFDLPIAIVRPFNTYGPRQSARAVIPTIITQALDSNKVALGDLAPKRDLTFVLDTVDGFLKVAAEKKTIGEVTNIGSGFEISIGDLAKKIIKLTDSKAKIVHDAKRLRPKKSEVGRLLADNRKAARLVGWEPRHSLDAGLNKTIEWIKTNRELYKTGIYNV